MKLLKKIVLLSTLFLTIFCISSKYYLKDKEKQVEAVHAAPVNPSEYFDLYNSYSPIYLGSDPIYAYYADISIVATIDYVKITDTALLNSIDIETIIFAYVQNDQTQREIYYDDTYFDLTQYAINVFETDYIYINFDFISSDWDTNFIEIDININNNRIEDLMPTNDEVEIDISLRDPLCTFFVQNDFTKAVQEFKFNQGESIGYENGYSEGEEIGYENGYKRGLTDGQTTLDFTFISKMFEHVNDFLSLEPFPGLKLWYIVAGPLVIALIVGVLKFLR